MNRVLETTHFVTQRSKFVKINFEALASFANNFDHTKARHWLSAAPMDLSNYTNDEKLHFLVLLNAISFSYWGNPNWVVEYDNQRYNGAWGMILALYRAIREGENLLDFRRCAEMTYQNLKTILRGDAPIPLLENRLDIIRGIGSTMMASYDGKASNMIEEANGDALRLLEIIPQRFVSFNDIATYEGREVFFFKRAQLLVGDIYQLFNGNGLGALKNVDQLTACADYKLPMLLRKYGIFEYNESLSNKIDNRIPILRNSEEEIEIRANTIWAVEYIKKYLRERNLQALSIEINDQLWLATQEKYPDDKPYHRTRTTAY